MWKLVEISRQTYFIYCNFDTNKETVTFILYDLNETWCETLSISEVKQKVKILNKRYDFNEENIKEAFLNTELQLATIEQRPHTSIMEQKSCLLKLKYRLKNCPFHFEWSLKRQTFKEFQLSFVQPLLIALFGCRQQVEILTDCLEKKNAELIQFHKEGAVLRRKTLATKPFNFNEFNKRFEYSSKLTAGFEELAKYIMQTRSNEVSYTFDSPHLCKLKEEKEEKCKRTNFKNNANTKMSLKLRKRRAKMQHLEYQLKIRKQGFKYESSQSQTTNNSGSEIIEGLERDQKSNECSSDDASQPICTRSRYASIKDKPKNKSGEYKKDLDKDADIRLMYERKSKRVCGSLTKNINKNSEKVNSEKNIPTYIINGDIEASDKCTKSFNSEDLNICDFSTTAVCDGTFEERRKLNKSIFSQENDEQFRSKSVIENLPDVTVVSLKTHIQKGLCHSPTPAVIDDLSTQLNNIKKELECLEAMRLADLKQRLCKA